MQGLLLSGPLLALCLCVLPAASAALVPVHEVESLQRLFESTAGYAWRWQPEEEAGAVWNFTRDSSGEYVHNPCSSSGQTWQGLSCTANASECSKLSCSITGIVLLSYGLTGELPPELGNLTHLDKLDLSTNTLFGTIPVELGQLTSLTWLAFYINALTGTIPPELGQLVLLEALDFSSNKLTSSIPSDLVNPMSLQFIVLYSNELTGTIPPATGDLLSLQWLFISDNKLSGTIPPQLGNLASLELLDLSINKFSGSIPPELGNLQSLQWVTLQLNNITGTIPSTLGELSLLQWLVLYFNEITGRVPSELSKLSNLQWLDVTSNVLTGTLPPELGNLVSLQWFLSSLNAFTGRIPPDFGKLSSLVWLYLQSNELTGSIPAELGDLVHLEKLYLHTNILTGTIPSTLCQLTLLEWVFLDSNELSGTIPNELGNLVSVEMLDFGSNRLSGTIPMALANLSTAMVLALSVNCLDNEIPTSFCDMHSIEVLSLNGLGMAGNCGNSYTMPLSGTTVMSGDGEFEIPSCLWSLEKLVTLHLTGNGFVGEIDTGGAPFGSHLEDVSLSHNRLSGTIPSAILNMRVVDLSYNHFEGHLGGIVFRNDSNETTVLHTEVNRLSGRLSTAALATFSSLDVLRGNMFSCDTIPQNDVDSFGYICGSQLYDYSLFFCAGCFTLLIAFFGCSQVNAFRYSSFWNITKESMNYLLCFYSPEQNGNNDYLDQVSLHVMCMKLKRHIFFFMISASIIIIGSVPLLAIRLLRENGVDSTHWNTYSWTFSYAYLEGRVMGSLVLVVWVLAMIALVSFMHVIYGGVSLTQKTCGDIISVNNDKGKEGWNVYIVLAFFSNFCVTVSVNVLFIMSSTELSLSPAAALTIRFAVSFFRVLSSIVIVPLLMAWVKDPVKKSVFMFRLLMFNNFLIPCVVTALTSSNCFQELLIEPDDINTVYTYQECAVVDVSGDCASYRTVSRETIAFVPGFSYNHQCTSVLLEAYVPVLLIGFCLQLLLPALLLLFLSTGNYGSLPLFLSSNFNGILWPEHWCGQMISSTSFMPESSQLMNTPSILCTDIVHPMAVMMTFGFCSPPLAFLAAIVGILKCSMWIGAVKHFCAIVENFECGEGDRKRLQQLVMCFTKVPFPYDEVMMRVFWIIFMYSIVFVLFLHWDTVSQVEWEGPLALSLFAILSGCLIYRDVNGMKKFHCLDEGKRNEVEVMNVSSNPLSVISNSNLEDVIS